MFSVVVRNPIYLKDENGQEYFWGFTIAILRVPEVFEDSTNALSKFKYNYRLSREASVLDKKHVVVDANCDKMIRPVTYDLTVEKKNGNFKSCLELDGATLKLYI